MSAAMTRRRCASCEARDQVAKYRHSGVCSQINSANTGRPRRLDGMRAQVSRISFESGWYQM